MSRLLSNTVVEGEASESDSDNESQQKSVAVRPSTLGVVISGEASESDDDDGGDGAHKSISPITPLRVDTEKQGDNAVLVTTPPATSTRQEQPPQFDSLLHKKLYEKNISLHNQIQELVALQYTSCAKDLHTMVMQMTKSQTTVQDVSHNMQLLTNDLFHLEDKVDIIATCQILPVINITVPSKSSSAASSPRSSPSR